MASALWRIDHYGRERRSPGDTYWWDNRQRSGDVVVCQLTRSGELLVRDARGDHRVPAGHAALFGHPGESEYGLPPDACETYAHEWVVLHGAGLREHWEELLTLGGPVVVVPPEGPLERLFQRLGEVGDPRARTPPEVQAAAIHDFVMALHTQAREAVSRDQRPVERAIDALLAAPAAAWSLKEMADLHGVSREHLARAFAKRVGCPPAAWLAQARVQRAIELLERTDLPIQAVRDQAGFASSHALIRRVRTATGLTPGAVRERARRR